MHDKITEFSSFYCVEPSFLGLVFKNVNLRVLGFFFLLWDYTSLYDRQILLNIAYVSETKNKLMHAVYSHSVNCSYTGLGLGLRFRVRYIRMYKTYCEVFLRD